MLGAPRSDGHACGLGSVKSNFGHTEAAAGIAGLIKVVLSLEHDQLPAHLHFEQLNPNISLKDTPFFIPTELRPWRSEGAPRVAGVSSFGWSGTNAHVVIEEAPPQAAPPGGARRRAPALAAVGAEPGGALGPRLELPQPPRGRGVGRVAP